MNILKTFLGLAERKENTDFNKIKVTSNGAFYMKSEDIFDDKEKSLKLIKGLRNSMNNYKDAKTNSPYKKVLVRK